MLQNLKKYWLHYLIINLVFINIASVVLCSGEKENINFNGYLYKLVLAKYLPKDILNKLDIKNRPKEIQNRLNKFLARREKFVSEIYIPEVYRDEAKNEMEISKIWQLQFKQKIERNIFSILDIENIKNIAFEYVENATVFYEWEGLASAPLDEALYATE